MINTANIASAASAAITLSELNKSFGGGKNSKHFTSLRTRKKKPDTWWDSLSWDSKLDVGSAAIHFQMMSANYGWEFVDYEDLKKSQKKMVTTIFSLRNKKWEAFPLKVMLLKMV